MDYDGLAFLFLENHRNAIPGLTGVENNFHARFQDIEIRSKLREEEVYNALKSAGLADTATRPSIPELNEILGPKLFRIMQESTNRIISTVTGLQRDLCDIQEKLISVLEEVFPGSNFIRYMPPKPDV